MGVRNVFRQFWIDLRVRLAALFQRHDLRARARDELQFHLEMREQRMTEAGVSPELARKQALRQFGNPTLITEQTTESWRYAFIETLIQDLRYALRGLRNHPGFTTTAVVSIALGVGANTAIFSLYDALMLRYLPVHDPQDLVQLITIDNRPEPTQGFSSQLAAELAKRIDIFSGVAAYSSRGPFNVGPPGQTERIGGAWVTGGFYATLGIQPVAGRLLMPSDDERDAPAVAVITDSFWEQQYRRDPRAIGETLLVEGIPVTIVGVSAPGFTGATVGEMAHLTLPVQKLRQITPSGAWITEGASSGWLRILARPQKNVSPPQAQARLAVAWPQLIRAITPEGSGAFKVLQARKPSLIPGGTGTTSQRGQFARPLRVLMGVVGLVLLLACANVANLLLARGGARRREISIRLGIGASRARIVRQLLTETGLLALLGGGLGIVLAWFSGSFLVEIVSSGRANRTIFDLTPNWRILAFTAVVAVGSSVLFGFVPAWRTASLRVTRSSTNLLSILVTVQVALSLLLVIGAGLFSRTLQNLRTLDPGFRRDGVLLVDVPAGKAASYVSLVERVELIPGVMSASVSVSTPLGDLSLGGDITANGETANLLLPAVAPRYFETLRIPLREGRDFIPRDNSAGEKVVVVNEAFAKRFFPDGAVGRHILFGNRTDDRKIVGVVGDAIANSLRRGAPPTVYSSLLQGGPELGSSTLLVHANGSLSQVAAALRDELRSTLPGPPDVRTLDSQVERALVQERLMASLAGAFGTVALALAAVGLYGLLAYTVSRDTKEIGIRIALGAWSRQVLGNVLLHSVRLACIGIALGLPAAWAASRLISSMLFGLEATDALTYGGAALLLLAVAIAAAFVPARRASRVEPMTALRLDS